MATEFEIVRGMNETLVCYIQSQAGEVIDLTGYSSITLYANMTLNATSPSISKSASSVTPSVGHVFFNLSGSDTESLNCGEYLAEVKVVIGSTTYTTNQPFIFRIKQRVKS